MIVDVIENELDWTPTTSPPLVETSLVLGIRADELRMEQQLHRLIYYGLRYMSLATGIVLPVFFAVVNDPHGIAEWVTTLAIAAAMSVFMLSIPLYYLAELLDRRLARSCVFERESGRFRRSKRDGTVEAEAELERIAAVQFLLHGALGNLGQINLVLDDGSRLHLYSGQWPKKLRGNAGELAKWLDKPLLERPD